MLDTDYEFIRDLVYRHSRINLGPDKKALVSARLGKRLRATKIATITDYCRFLQGQSDTDELSHLIDVISTNHTFFFREPAHFDFLKDRAWPELRDRARKQNWQHLSIWSAASSSGEEPYSLAITLAELEARDKWGWRMEATDISHRILARARQGIFDASVVDRIERPLVARYFLRGFGPQNGKYCIKSSLQKRITFRQLNLLDSKVPYAEPFQVIFCRNVMIYFDRPTQEELVNRLTSLLVPGGYLMVGHSESLTAINHKLKAVAPATYRKPD